MSKRATFGHQLASGWRPHDRRPMYEWARDNVILPASYAIEGPFHVEKSRYMVEPFNAVSDDTIREVTIRAGLQTGKSLIGDIAVCHLICNRPVHLLWNFPTDEQADNYAGRRAIPLLEHCPPIAARFDKLLRHDKRKNEIRFGNMWFAIQGAHERNLQTHSVPWVINEELWEWDQGMYVHAKARTTYFSWRSKILNISQSGILGDDLDQAFEAGSKEELQIACPHCHEYQRFEWNVQLPDGTWAGMIWDKNDRTKPGDNIYNFDLLRPTVRYRCRHCLSDILDTPSNRKMLVDFCRFEKTNPNANAENRSFHWPSWICDEISWGKMAEEYLRAKQQQRLGNVIPIREFYQKRAAVPYDADKFDIVDRLPVIKLESRTDGKFWEKQDFIFLAVDVQQHHFWALVVAWSKNGELMVLWAGKLFSWGDIAAKQAEFKVANRCVFVDSKYKQSEVFQHCVRNGSMEGNQFVCWVAMRGEDRNFFTYVPTRGAHRGHKIRLPYSWPATEGNPCFGLHSDDPLLAELHGKFCPVIAWSNPTIKDIALQRRNEMAKGERSMVAVGVSDDFSRQMYSEQRVKVRDKFGRERWHFELIGRRPNHLWDCFCMAVVGAAIVEIIVMGEGLGNATSEK